MKKLKFFSKILSMLFIIGLLFTLVACGESGKENSEVAYAVAYAESSSNEEPLYGSSHYGGLSLDENVISLKVSKIRLRHLKSSEKAQYPII